MRTKVWKRVAVVLVGGAVLQLGAIGSGGCINALMMAIPVGMGFSLGADLSQSLGLGSLLPGLGGDTTTQ